jgi:glycosyltransferase involved in cell wall biosynthesis
MMAAGTAVGPGTQEPESTRGVRVLHVVRNLDTGGAQEVVRTLVEHLAEEGAHPVVCSLSDGPLAAAIIAAGIPIEIIEPRRNEISSPLSFHDETRRIRDDFRTIVQRHHIDVIQTHLLRNIDFTVASLASRRGEGPHVFWTFHNEAFTLRREHLSRHRWLLGPKRFAYRIGYRLRSRDVAGLIAVSSDVGRAIGAEIGRVHAPITVIPNGVDTRRYGRDPASRTSVRRELSLPDTATLVVVVATFKEQKGHRYLVAAASRLLPEYPSAHILFVGDGELKLDIETAVAGEGIEDQVHFLGDRRDVPRLLAGSDLFVLPSLWEGLPMSLLEAMAAGLPCIATSVSGVREVIDGDSGLIVPPRDVDALESALRRLLDDRGRAATLGARARRRVEERYSARSQARAHLDLYRRTVADSDRP